MKVKLFLFISFLTSTLLAQVPINGFCKFRQFPTKENYFKIFAADINNNGWRDVILTRSDQKGYLIQFWLENKFTSTLERKINFSITDLKLESTLSKGIKKYVLLSRSDRILSTGTFSSNGVFQPFSKVKLSGYASNFDIDDVDNDRKNEILIYGSNYNGLSIFSESKGKLYESLTLEPKKLFSYANFIDLDYDGFKDIAAVDFLKNSILFFYNNRAGDFREIRAININEEIKQFKTVDVNSDGFADLIYVSNNKFIVFKGDSVSSFVKKIEIECPYIPDKYEIFDFNGDGFNDIAFVNVATGSLYIIYAKNSEYFYEPILYLKRKGIVDFQAFVDRGGRKILMIDTNGKLYLIDKVLTITDNLAISIQSKPSHIGNFSYMFNKMNGIYFIDEDDLSLNIFIGTKGNYFEQYYKVPISLAYNKTIVEEVQSEEVIFYCYKTGRHEIEIIKVNFEINSINRRILYTKGKIVELKIVSDKSKEQQTIFALIKMNNILYLESFEFRNFRYVNSVFYEISKNAEAASFSLNVSKEIYFYTKSNNVVYLNKIVYDNKLNPPINISTYILSDPMNYFIEIKSFSNQYDIDRPIVGIIKDAIETKIILIKSGNFRTVQISNFFPEKDFLFYEKFNDTENVYMYDRTKGIIKIISLGKNFHLSKMNDFFVSTTINNYISISVTDKILIAYTDYSDNLIKFSYLR
ncbi:MAG: VCBS repeat-containing protein [Melioribacter sp.]|nr:VCBS repeat-containing protein [Melioribacter sp.]